MEESKYQKIKELLESREPRTELESYLLRNLRQNTVQTIQRRFEEDPDMRSLYYQLEDIV